MQSGLPAVSSTSQLVPLPHAQSLSNYLEMMQQGGEDVIKGTRVLHAGAPSSSIGYLGPLVLNSARGSSEKNNVDDDQLIMKGRPSTAGAAPSSACNMQMMVESRSLNSSFLFQVINTWQF